MPADSLQKQDRPSRRAVARELINHIEAVASSQAIALRPALTLVLCRCEADWRRIDICTNLDWRGQLRPEPFVQRSRWMAFEKLRAQISLLVTQMENQPQDKHELYLQLRERLNEMRSLGMGLPEDLIRLEQDLEEEFAGTAKRG
jgi:hypothetical protein